MLAIRGEQLTKYYRNRKVLDVSRLNIVSGTITAIVGPNGAGKSTLLRLLSLVEPPTSGKLEIFGSQPKKQKDRLHFRRQMAIVFQQPLLFSGTVEQNLTLGLSWRRIPFKIISERVNEALDWFLIRDLRKAKVSDLSQGQLQRVSLARALTLRPRILFLDEPFSNLDNLIKDKLFLLLPKLLKRYKITTVYVSHDLEEVSYFADQVLGLAKGRLKSNDSQGNLWSSQGAKVNGAKDVWSTSNFG
jgi:tungstate transport system ATP-binding protein